MGIEADYVCQAHRHELFSRNSNLTYNPADGRESPEHDDRDAAGPQLGQRVAVLLGRRRGLPCAAGGFHRSGSATGGRAVGDVPAVGDVGRDSAAGRRLRSWQPDMGAERALASGDQRHRVVFNGIVEAGYGFQLSGIYFFGSGQRFSTVYSCRSPPDGVEPDRPAAARQYDCAAQRLRRRADSSRRRAPAEAVFVGRTLSIDGIAEVFNLFNRANYGSWVTDEANARYGSPNTNTAIAYQPRMGQLGFLMAFYDFRRWGRRPARRRHTSDALWGVTEMNKSLLVCWESSLFCSCHRRLAAHHSFAAEFDIDKPITLRGMLVRMDWVNPHGWLYIEVKNPDGTVTRWAVEAGGAKDSCGGACVRPTSRWAWSSSWKGTSRGAASRSPTAAA